MPVLTRMEKHWIKNPISQFFSCIDFAPFTKTWVKQCNRTVILNLWSTLLITTICTDGSCITVYNARFTNVFVVLSSCRLVGIFRGRCAGVSKILPRLYWPSSAPRVDISSQKQNKHPRRCEISSGVDAFCCLGFNVAGFHARRNAGCRCHGDEPRRVPGADTWRRHRLILSAPPVDMQSETPGGLTHMTGRLFHIDLSKLRHKKNLGLTWLHQSSRGLSDLLKRLSTVVNHPYTVSKRTDYSLNSSIFSIHICSAWPAVCHAEQIRIKKMRLGSTAGSCSCFCHLWCNMLSLLQCLKTGL